MFVLKTLTGIVERFGSVVLLLTAVIAGGTSALVGV